MSFRQLTETEPMKNRSMTTDFDQTPLRQDGILDAALTVFSSYGYRRTAMEDIAQGAGISRSALYLHFRNKEDIFKSLAARYFEEAAINMAAELAKQGQSGAETLANAFYAYDGKIMELVLGTPHGAEMLEAGHMISADLVMAGEKRIHKLLENWLDAQAFPAVLGTAHGLAETILSALKGLKQSAKTPQTYRASQAQLALVLALAMDR